MNTRQQGFTLVSVMLLSMMAGVLVFTSLKDSIVQERLSGNFQKKVNARLMSERAVFQQAENLQQQLNAHPDSSIEDLIQNTQQANSQSLYGDDLKYQAKMSQNANGDIEIAALGERYSKDAQASLVARYRVISGSNASAFTTAIVGCEGVSNVAGGLIDSYDSIATDGQYSYNNASQEADIKTLSPNANITVSGGSTTWGDVRATGNITVDGGAFISGTVHANKDITISGGVSNKVQLPASYPEDTRIGGDILAGQNLAYQGGYILGQVRVVNNLHFTPSFAVLNQQNQGKNVLYGGTNTTKTSAKDTLNGENYLASQYNQAVNVPLVTQEDPSSPDYDANNPDSSCDPFDIAQNIEKLSQLGPRQGLAVKGWGNHAHFNAQQGVDGQGTVYQPISTTLLGKHYESVYLLDELMIDGAELTISEGDVTLYVKGDFTLTTNGNSALNIAKGATLSIFVEGKTLISQAANIEQKRLSDDNLPPLSIFSGYQSSTQPSACWGGDYGIEFSGTGDLYAAIYSPLTNVKLGASGSLFGAVRGKTVSVCGDGDIHYDTALKNATNGNLGSTSQVIFLGWQYKVFEQEDEQDSE